MPMNPRLLRPRAAATAGGFDPRQLGGLVLWLDASDRASLFDATTGGAQVSDNGGVARWEDKSGNGNHATQATSNDRPLVRPATKSGLSTLEFDGSSDFMRVPDANSLDLNTFTAFSVVRPGAYTITGTRAPAIFNKGDYATAAGTSYELTVSTAGRWSVGIASGGAFAAIAASSALATQATWALVAGRRPAASAATVFAARSSAGTTASVAGTLNNTSASIGIGARGTGTPSSTVDIWPGDIAEILLFNFALSDAQMAAIDNWLYAKWAL